MSIDELRATLPDEGCITKVGDRGAELLSDSALTSLRDRVGDSPFEGLANVLRALPYDGVIVYSGLELDLKYSLAFDLCAPLRLHTAWEGVEQQERVPFKTFGIYQLRPGDEHADRLASQVRIIWHRYAAQGVIGSGREHKNGDEFIVELLLEEEDPRLILAKLGQDVTTLRDAVQETVCRLRSPNTAALTRQEAANPRTVIKLLKMEDTQRSGFAHLLPFETLRIPVMNVRAAGRIEALEGLAIDPREDVARRVAVSFHSMEFSVDESGVKAESHAVVAGFARGPREFLFTPPFLVLMIRSDAERPFLAAWIGNTDCFESVAPRSE